MLSQLRQMIEIIEKSSPIHAKKIHKHLRYFDESFDLVFNDMINKFMLYLSDNSYDLHFATMCYLRMISDLTFEQINYLKNGCYSNSSFMEVKKRIYDNEEKLESFKMGLFISEILWPQHFLVFFEFIKLFNHYGKKSGKIIDIGGAHGQYLNYVITNGNIEKPVLCYTNPVSLDMVNWFVPQSNYTMIEEDMVPEHAKQYDWVVMGEILEHTENPGKYIEYSISLLRNGGFLFITAPINSPALDHVYCFKSKEEVLSLFEDKGLVIVNEFQVFAEESQNHKIGASSIFSVLFTIND